MDYKTYLHNKFKLGTCNKKSKHFGDFIPINFISNDLDKINFSKSLNNTNIYNLFPSKYISSKYSKKKFSFSCSFKQSQPIRSKIFNYRPTILSTDNLLDGNIICNCHLYSKHIDRSVGHVITGNVGIVKNKKLHDLFNKGDNYIESTFNNKYEIIKSLKKDINNNISKFSISLVRTYVILINRNMK